MKIKKLNQFNLYSIIVKRLLAQFKTKHSNLGSRHYFKNLNNSENAPNVLITYVSEVYDKKDDKLWMEGHANRWQTREITNSFLMMFRIPVMYVSFPSLMKIRLANFRASYLSSQIISIFMYSLTKTVLFGF